MSTVYHVYRPSDVHSDGQYKGLLLRHRKQALHHGSTVTEGIPDEHRPKAQ